MEDKVRVLVSHLIPGDTIKWAEWIYGRKRIDKVFEILPRFYPYFGTIMRVLDDPYNALDELFKIRTQLIPFAERLKQNLHAANEVLILGDADADGILSSSIIASVLKQQGKKVLLLIVRDRRRPIATGLRVAASMGFSPDLVVATDMGTSEILGTQFHIPVFVVDHHQHAEGEASNLYNPGIEFTSGGFLAYLVASLLVDSMENISNLFSLAAATLVSDVAPLVSVNSLFLRKMGETLQDLHQFVEYIRWQISPRVNAFARFVTQGTASPILPITSLDSAYSVFSSSYQYYREVLETALEEAKVVSYSNLFTVVEVPPKYAPVKGIVAMRLRKTPVVCAIARVEGDSEGPMVSASVRSKFPIFDAVLDKLREKSPEMLEYIGGHMQAFGYSGPPKYLPILLQTLSELDIKEELASRVPEVTEYDISEISRFLTKPGHDIAFEDSQVVKVIPDVQSSGKEKFVYFSHKEKTFIQLEGL